ncbi:hypothetical protein BVH01_10445 [Pseudomonas sp. PA1(2017)]|nr:hypothetical protein BVH01_10445 [Pseudomonas sp. PA1(2017)]
MVDGRVSSDEVDHVIQEFYTFCNDRYETELTAPILSTQIFYGASTTIDSLVYILETIFCLSVLHAPSEFNYETFFQVQSNDASVGALDLWRRVREELQNAAFT